MVALPAAALLGLLLAAGALRAQGPDTLGRPEPSPLPSDVALGLEIAMSLEQSVGVVDRPEWALRLNDIGYRVAAVSGDDSTPYSFGVLDLDEPNALALPGGFIFVTRGLMDINLNDAEMAHLVGHEISHVRRHHFERAARLDAVLSLARAAVTMGLLMSARDRSATHERSVASEDPGQRSWAVGMTGPEAVVQASALFGSVLQALFERGYSRKLEFEADETGERLAARAGYAPQAGASLLQTLRNRSYEGHRYSYWRTHPYFDERVSRARSRAARHKAATAVADDAAYRERTALFFASAAQRMRDDGQALYLYRRALQCEPRGPASYAAALELARFKRQRQGRDPVLRRPYAELIAAYDALIERAEREDPAWRDLPVAREERAALEHEREEAHPDYLAAVERRDVPTEILERFAQNFPADPRRAEIIYRLAVHHEMAGKPARALEHLSTLIAEGGAWADSAVTVVLRTLPQVDEMTDCCRWLSDSLAAGPDSVRARIAEAAGARVEALIAADFTLEAGSRFLAACPDSPWSGAVREKVAARAEAEYRNGRVQEGMHRYQEALDSYYAVLAYAPDSSNASEAQAAIDRIHRAAADD